jgi:flagellar protein FlaJ
VGVVIIGYLVYLLVIVMLDVSFLTPIAELDARTADVAGGPEAPVSFQGVPVSTYRMIFFHSVLIQGIGSGLLTGELASNDIYNGLKYSIFLVLLALLAFIFV